MFKKNKKAITSRGFGSFKKGQRTRKEEEECREYKREGTKRRRLRPVYQREESSVILGGMIG